MTAQQNRIEYGVILNLTQHPATQGQRDAGVLDFGGETLIALKALLTFDRLPSGLEVSQMAQAIARLAADFLRHESVGAGRRRAMIGGAPYLMAPLEHELLAKGIQSLYAFGPRVSMEEIQPDGSVQKTNIFRHEGFIPGHYQ